MKKYIVIMILLVMLFSLTFGQGMSESEKMMMFESQKKNPTTAMIYSCLLTSSGHAYAGNWARGLGFTAGRVGCGVLAIALGFEEKTEDYGWYTQTTLEVTPMYYIGVLGAAVIGIWEMVDASNEVKKYNANVYEKIYGKKQPGFSLNMFPVKKGTGISLAYNF